MVGLLVGLAGEIELEWWNRCLELPTRSTIYPGNTEEIYMEYHREFK